MNRRTFVGRMAAGALVGMLGLELTRRTPKLVTDGGLGVTKYAVSTSDDWYVRKDEFERQVKYQLASIEAKWRRDMEAHLMGFSGYVDEQEIQS